MAILHSMRPRQPTPSRRFASAWLIALALLGGCSKKQTDEERIDAVIGECIESAEALKVGGIMEHISEQYSDPRGLKRQDLKGLLASQFFQRKALYVFKLGHEITLEPPSKARSTLKIIMAASEGAVPNERDAQVFDLEWALEESDWRITSADYRQMRAGDLLGN